MNARVLRWFLPLLFLSAGFASAATVSRITATDDGTYKVTATAGHMFTRNTDKLAAEATKAATEFCKKEGKQLKVLSLEEDKSLLVYGSFSSVTLTFKALKPGDPELAPASIPVAAPAPASEPMTSDKLAGELTKLDDLRKKGLLTDEEFQTLKEKLLNRF